MTTADRLKMLMHERGLKQTDIIRLCQPLCKKYGERLERNDLSQYVSGRNRPRQNKLTILGEALGVSEAWLMGYDVPRDRNTEAPETDEFTPHERELIRAYRARPDMQAAVDTLLGIK